MFFFGFPFVYVATNSSIFDIFDNQKKISKIKCMTLVIHGSNDSVIDISHSRVNIPRNCFENTNFYFLDYSKNNQKLAEQLGSFLWALKEIEGANHHDLTTEFADDVLENCVEFVNSLQPADYHEEKQKHGAVIPGLFANFAIRCCCDANLQKS